MENKTSMPEFIHHSIELPNGEFTRAGVPLLANSGKMKSAKRILDGFFKSEDPSKTTVIDLGCMEGGTTLEFARWGYKTLGLEARESNLERCRYMQSKMNLPNLHFVKDNMLNVEAHGKFDIIYASGVLYHVKDPVDFIEILSRATKSVLILNTHYASDPPPPKTAAKLGEMTEYKGRKGQWFSEWPDPIDQIQLEGRRKAAYDTHRAFWLAKDELLDALKVAGFDLVFEQYDQMGRIVKQFPKWRENARQQFVAIKL